MDGVIYVVVTVSYFCRDHLTEIVTAMTAVTMVFSGKSLSAIFCGWTAPMHGIVRIPVRTAIHLALFGAIIYFIPDLLADLLSHFDNYTLAPVLLILILLVGLASDRYSR